MTYNDTVQAWRRVSADFAWNRGLAVIIKTENGELAISFCIDLEG
jgi:hypothetical protein